MNSSEKFIKAYYSFMQEYFVEYSADEFEITKENYWETVLEPSEVKEKDFIEIESQLKVRLPETFKNFYKNYYSLDKDFNTGGLFIAGSQKKSKLGGLKDYLFEQGISDNILNEGLIPFGLYQDEFYVCLDLNQNKVDPPVVLYDMNNWEEEDKAKFTEIWFSNFNKLLECIADYMTTGDIKNFDKIDPGSNY